MDGPVTDAMEATALTFNFHFIDIYVCSWGPRDDGAEMDGPNVLTEQAFRLGTHEASPNGRQRTNFRALLIRNKCAPNRPLGRERAALVAQRGP